jgi:hypothetical protein
MLGAGDPAFFKQFIPEFKDLNSGLLTRLSLEIVKMHLTAGLSGKLGNTTPHSPNANHGYLMERCHMLVV